MIKYAVFQPLVPKYRTPIFNELVETGELDLTIYAGGDIGSLKSDAAERKFKLVYSNLKRHELFGQSIYLQDGMFRVILRKDYDLLILSWDSHYIQLPIAILFSRIIRRPVILWGHGYSKKPSHLSDFIRNIYGRMANGVLVYSDSIAKRLIENFHFNYNKVFVAQNTISLKEQNIELNKWINHPELIENFKKNNSLYDGVNLIYVSRLEPENNVEFLIEGLVKFLDYSPSSKLILIGDGESRSSLIEYANRQGVLESIIFTGAIYDECKIAPWMISADIFCYSNNIGLSIIHAFSYGLPVVVSDNKLQHGPEVDALSHEYNGLFFEDGNLDDMVNQWIRLSEDNECKFRLSRNARKTIEEKYTVENMVKGFKDLMTLLN